MKAEVAALQDDHHRQVEELSRRHAADIVTSHVEDMHRIPGSLAAASNLASSSPGTFGSAGAMDGVASQAAEVPVETSAVLDLDSGEADTAVGVSLRGKSIDGAELGTPVALQAEPTGSPRRLPGFFSIGTTGAGVGCMEFGSSATTEAVMSATTCRGATDRICSGCFIAAESANNKILEIIQCSTARYKLGAKLATSSAEYVVMIEIINADVDHTLTVKGCSDATCSPAASSYLLAAKDSAVGYCYHGSGNAIYFGTSGIQNAATFDFSGKTITNLGTVTTADINGGTIDAADITVGSSKTLDVSAGVLTLANGQIAAAKVTGGVFKTGQSYSFAGSTVANLGTVTTANIDGGTIDATTIGASDITVGNSKTLDVSAGTLTLGAGQIAADRIKAGTFTAGATYSFDGSTIADLGTVTTADINGGTIDAVTIAASDITVGTSKTLNVAQGTLTLNGGQIAASAIKGGTFATGTNFDFTGSTISVLGTVTTADINGGTIDGVTIAASTGTFNDISTSSTGVVKLGRKAVITASGARIADFNTLQVGGNNQNGVQQGVITSGVTSLAAGDTYTITVTNDEIEGTTSIILATAGVCTGGQPGVISVTPLAGSGLIKVKNHHTSPCSSDFKVYFVIFP